MTGIAVLSLCAGMTSCSHDEDLFVPMQDAKSAEYQEAFTKAFGQIAPNQDWGFGTSTTRATANNSNNWGGNGVAGSEYPQFNVPDTLTTAQKEVVRKWFQTHKNPEPSTVTFTNFFVQQVYKGGANTEGSLSTETYLAGNGESVVGSTKMDLLMAGQTGTYIDYLGNQVAVYDNMSNFNGANYSNGAKTEQVWNGELDADDSKDFNDRKLYYYDQIMLMVNSSTSSFGYHTSQSNQDFHNKYVLVSGDQISPLVAGMYFVGFDYEATGNGSNEYIVTADPEGDLTVSGHEGTYKKGGADGYYSDWIVRITKAEGTADKVVASGRIFCEDLGSSFDFDFNDVVFDAYIYESGKTKIVLQAAGGELEAYVGEIAADKSNEVHKLMGGSMVNTGLRTGRTVAFWIDPIAAGTPRYATLRDIPVYIIQTNAAHYTETIMLKAEIGSAPQKICFPLYAKWADEWVDIEAVYPLWKSWINHKDGITSAVQVVDGGWSETLTDLNLDNNGSFTNRYGKK